MGTSKTLPFAAGILVSLILYGGCTEDTSTVWLDDLEIKSFAQGIRPVKPSVNYRSRPIQINGKVYERGVGVITTSVLQFSLEGRALRFRTAVGPDDAGNAEIPVSFFVVADRKVLFASGEMLPGYGPAEVDVDLTGVDRLGLLVTDDGEQYGPVLQGGKMGLSSDAVDAFPVSQFQSVVSPVTIK